MRWDNDNTECEIKVIMDCFKVILKNFHGETDANNGWSVIRQIFESQTSRIRAWNFRYPNLSLNGILQIYTRIRIIGSADFVHRREFK
jgi:hypothetical protein